MSQSHSIAHSQLHSIGAITAPQGFSAAACTAGIKESGLPDLALLASDRPAAAAALFTTNQTQAAPLGVSRDNVADGSLRGAIINSGNANCATGPRGVADARTMTELAAAQIGCDADEIFVNSTGIIGHFLPMDLLHAAVPKLEPRPNGGADFARAIMTTDTFPKEAVATFEANGRTYTIGGCAKGAGMIHPNMATMIALCTTDAPIDRALLDARFRRAIDRSINMVTVDGDTSTNDTALILANGAAGGPTITAADAAAVAAFDEALAAVCVPLAKMIATDGEGATKRIEMTVIGAPSWENARDIARTVVTSPLVKAALSKADPNWGRVLMAAGYAGVPYELDKIKVWIGDLLVFDGIATGIPDAEASKQTVGPEVQIRLDLAAGDAEATAWGCDLTEEYVSFNADYVT